MGVKGFCVTLQAKLEEELRRRDLDASGTKVELIDRLHKALTVFLVPYCPLHAFLPAIY